MIPRGRFLSAGYTLRAATVIKENGHALVPVREGADGDPGEIFQALASQTPLRRHHLGRVEEAPPFVRAAEMSVQKKSNPP